MTPEATDVVNFDDFVVIDAGSHERVSVSRSTGVSVGRILAILYTMPLTPEREDFSALPATEVALASSTGDPAIRAVLVVEDTVRFRLTENPVPREAWEYFERYNLERGDNE